MGKGGEVEREFVYLVGYNLRKRGICNCGTLGFGEGACRF